MATNRLREGCPPGNATEILEGMQVASEHATISLAVVVRHPVPPSSNAVLASSILLLLVSVQPMRGGSVRVTDNTSGFWVRLIPPLVGTRPPRVSRCVTCAGSNFTIRF